jgi:mono/diheme cytochrome c family protein
MGVTHHEPVRSVPAPDFTNPVARGEYMVRLGHCWECHSLGSTGPQGPDSGKYMAGASMAMEMKGVGKVWAPNLTPDPETGLGRYSDEQIKESLRSGKRLDGKTMAAPMSLFIPHISGLTEEDMDGLLAYLRSLKPVKNKVPERQLSPEGLTRVGEQG